MVFRQYVVQGFTYIFHISTEKYRNHIFAVSSYNFIFYHLKLRIFTRNSSISKKYTIYFSIKKSYMFQYLEQRFENLIQNSILISCF